MDVSLVVNDRALRQQHYAYFGFRSTVDRFKFIIYNILIVVNVKDFI